MAAKKLAVAGASLAVLAAATLGAAPAAHGHAGPDAVPVIRSFALAPAAQGWTASLTIVDSDSGAAVKAVDVQLRGAGVTKLTPMVESASGGTYTLALPNAEPGPAELHLRLRELPGGTKVLDLTEDYTGTLEAGKPWLVVGAAPTAGSGGAGSGIGPVAGGAAGLLIAAAATTIIRRRRRTVTPLPG